MTAQIVKSEEVNWRRELKKTKAVLFEAEKSLVAMRVAGKIVSDELNEAADAIRCGNILRAIQLMEASRRRLDIAAAVGIRTDFPLVDMEDEDGEDE
jgi:hypothetical protein